MSGRYDRRPRRDWDDRARRRGIGEQIGGLRVIGLIVIFAGSFVLLNRKDDPTPPPSEPRIAADAAIAPTIRQLLPSAKLTAGASDELADQIRGGRPVVDLAVLSTSEVAPLVGEESCAAPQPIAQRTGATYAACLVNADGSSRALATTALNALTGLRGREALLDACFEIPDVRPTSASTTP